MLENQDVTAAPPAEPIKKRGVPALFWGMLVRPRATLAYLREAGGASWIWPALLALLVLIVSLTLTASITRATAEAQLEAVREQLGDDATARQQLEQGARLVGNPLFVVVLPAVTGAFGLAIVWLIRGGALHLFGLALGGQSTFGAMFRMGVWTTLPDVLRQLVTALGTVAAGRTLQSGLAFLVPTPPGQTIPTGSTALWQAFLGGIDVYWLWGLALTVVGVAVTARFSWRKALVVTLAYWALTVLVTVGWVWVSLSLAAQAGFSP